MEKKLSKVLWSQTYGSITTCYQVQMTTWLLLMLLQNSFYHVVMQFFFTNLWSILRFWGNFAVMHICMSVCHGSRSIRKHDFCLHFICHTEASCFYLNDHKQFCLSHEIQKLSKFKIICSWQACRWYTYQSELVYCNSDT